MADYVSPGTGFNGDYVFSKFVGPTYKAKAIAIPGLTVPLKMEIRGQFATWKEPKAAEVEETTPGASVVPKNVGYKNHNVEMTKQLIASNYIDGATMQTNDQISDIVGTAAASQLARILRKYNQKFLDNLNKGATVLGDKVALTPQTIEKQITDTRAAFVTANADFGLEPKALIVSPATHALLVYAAGNKITKNETHEIWYTGYIGEYNGLTVIESTELPATVEYIMTCPEAYVAPVVPQPVAYNNYVDGNPGASKFQTGLMYGFEVTAASRVYAKRNA